MADNFRLTFTPNMMLPQATNGATFVVHSLQRLALAFDDTTNETVYLQTVLPPAYTGTGTLKARLLFYSASANSGDAGWQVAVEAVTPADTLDLETVSSFDTANGGTQALSGTAGDLTAITITLTNKDSCAAGDSFRIGIQRTAAGTDTVSGDLFLHSLELFEDE